MAKPTKNSPPASAIDGAKTLPSKIMLKRPYGYYTEGNLLRHWEAGKVIDDKSDIAELLARNAPYEVVSHG